MDKALKKCRIRLIYAGAFRYLGIVLILCAIIGGLYRSRMHFVFALCAGGGFFIAWGWFTFLAASGMKVPGFGKLPEQRKKVPYMYRKDKGSSRKPAFLMSSEDFDDDLNDEVSLSDDDFTEAQKKRIRMWSRLACGVLLFIVSFVIKY